MKTKYSAFIAHVCIAIYFSSKFQLQQRLINSAFLNIWSLKSGKHNQAIYINLYSDDLNEYTYDDIKVEKHMHEGN